MIILTRRIGEGIELTDNNEKTTMHVVNIEEHPRTGELYVVLDINEEAAHDAKDNR